MPTEMKTAPSRFAARVERFLERIEYRRAKTAAEIDALESLRYEAYLKEGAVPLTEERRLRDRFDDVPNVVNIGVFHDDSLISALRIHHMIRPGQESPALEVFGDILNPMIADGKRLVDCNRLVADYTKARQHIELPYATVRLSVMAATHYRANFATATVRQEHQAFYKKNFFAEPACPPRDYPTLTKQITLMLVPFEQVKEKIVEQNPFYASSADERERIFGAPVLQPVEADTQKQTA